MDLQVYYQILQVLDPLLFGHTLLFAPIIVLPVLITKTIFREIVWWKIWIILSLATIIGHILVDFLTHEVTLFYPLSSKEYE